MKPSRGGAAAAAAAPPRHRRRPASGPAQPAAGGAAPSAATRLRWRLAPPRRGAAYKTRRWPRRAHCVRHNLDKQSFLCWRVRERCAIQGARGVKSLLSIARNVGVPILVALIVFGFALAVGLDVASRDRILPGVSVLGVP